LTSHSDPPRRGEIWTAMLGNPPVRDGGLYREDGRLVVSLDPRNLSERVDSVLIVASAAMEQS
jgi:hypothetical protein